MKMSSYGFVAAIVLSSFILFFFQPQAQAATLTVTSIADSGAGTLRQAILDAVADDTITFDPTTFPPATPTTITLASQLTINKNLNINGNGGVILDANQTGRVMLIDDGTAAIMSVSLSGLTFNNGLVAGQGGGIYTKEHLTLANSIFTNNTATAPNAFGGGIHSETGATVTLTDSSFTANNANDGGAIYNKGPLSVSGCTFNANHANSSGSGGAVLSHSSTTILTNSTLSGNSAFSGGGLYGYAGTVTVNNSTFAFNTASAGGGGIYFYSGTLNLNSSIIGYNSASLGPDIYNNSATINADHCLIATATGHPVTNGVNGNIVGLEAMLLPLGNYGGATQTHAIKDTSPCISSGSNPQNLTTDQRGTGFGRVIDTIDMGAVEYTTNTLLSVSKEGNGTGTVTGLPTGINCGDTCSAAYDPHATVTLTATAGIESVFSGWSGACSGTGDCVVTMEEARNVTATFILNTYPLAIIKDGNGTGSVSSNPAGIACGPDCNQNYDYNTDVTLTATADADSLFTGWSEPTCTGTDPCVVTISQARSITATFTLKQYTVTTNATGTGNGTVTTDTGGISFSYPTTNNTGTTTPLNHGSSIIVTATAAPGSTVAWNGCAETGGTTTAATCSFSSLDSAKTVTATFTLNTYGLSILLEGNGKVTSDPAGIDCGLDCAETYNFNTKVTLTATPAAKATFKGWSGACSGTANTCVVTVDQALSVGARFKNDFPWPLFLPAMMNIRKE